MCGPSVHLRVRASSRMHRPLGPNGALCLLFPDFLDGTEVQALRAQLASQGFVRADRHYPPSYRSNLRQVFDDPNLADRLLPRVQALLRVHSGGDRGVPVAINPRWRSCQYLPGQAFPIHQDGVWHAPDGSASQLTFMVYLSDPQAFEGGDTVFYDGPPDHTRPPCEVARLKPTAGALIVFAHSLWHAGDRVSAGVKTILRSELMFHPTNASASRHGHWGYVFCLAALADGRVLSGGRDGRILLHSAEGTDHRLLGSHRQSVLGLAVWPDGCVASVGRDQQFALYAADNDQMLPRVQAHAGAALCVLALAADRWVTGGADHTIAVWQLRGGRLHETSRWRGHVGWVWNLCALSGGRIASVGEDGRLCLWQASGRLSATLALDVPLRAVCALPDVDALVFGDAAGRLHRVRVSARAGWQLERSVQAHDAQLRQIRADPHGGLLSAAEDGRILRWSTDLQLLRALPRRMGFATDVLRTANGVLVSAGYAGGVTWVRPGH